MKADYAPKNLEKGDAIIIGNASYMTKMQGAENLRGIGGLLNSVIDIAKNGKIQPREVKNLAVITFERQTDASDKRPKRFSLGNLYGTDYEINSWGNELKYYDVANIIPGKYKLVGITTFDYNSFKDTFPQGSTKIVDFSIPSNANTYFEVKAGEVIYIGDLIIRDNDHDRTAEVAVSDNTKTLINFIDKHEKFNPLKNKVVLRPLHI